VTNDQLLSLLLSPPNTVLLLETQGTQTDVTNSAHEPAVGGCCSGLHLSDAANGGDVSNGWIDWVSGTKYACGSSSTAGVGNPPRTVVQAAYITTPLHSPGTNFALCDGHVAFIPGSRVSPGYDAGTPNPQDQLSTGYAASTAYMGASPEKFVATFSEQ
jgi:prepilin-type processing-associated H-X9-DG protein